MEELFLDQIPVKKWGELVELSNRFSTTNTGLTMIAQNFESSNYKSGSAGWIIKSNGDVEFNDGTFRGAVSASTIDIGGADATSFHVDIDGNLWLGNAAFASAPFKVSNAGVLTATGATITGTITATTGTIGGFSVGADYIRDAANSMGLASTVTGGDDVRFWAGATFANRATAPFFATEAGAVTASNFSFTGGTVGSAVVVALGALNIAARGWTQTSVFSVTDADTVAWAAGTLTSADGTSYSIGAGNTGNMAARTYVYLDIAVSTIAYQVTTTATTAVGAGKVLVATAINGTVEPSYQVFGGVGGQNIDASSIVANSITANELSTSITYAGSIVIDSAGLIRSGQTAYNTGTGWWIGNVAGTPKLSIGNPAASYITWDGTSLVVNGYALASQGTFGGDGSDGALTITSGTTTVSLGGAQTVVLNYSSISITGTGKLAFSNPHANGTTIIVKCKGAMTLTSSSTSVIDTVGMGAEGGAGGAARVAGTTGTASVGFWTPTFNAGSGCASTQSASGAGGVIASSTALDVWTTGSGNTYKMHRRAIFVAPGSGGGGGAGAVNNGASVNEGAGAAGGAGGGCLLIECAGAFNFTTGSIDVSGQAGTAAPTTAANEGGNSTASGGGGGGGSAGMCLVLYNTLTANTGTIIAKGGIGGAGGAITGNGGNDGDPGSGGGGGGAAGYGAAGAAGGAGTHPASTTKTNGTDGAAGNLGSGGGGGSGAAADNNGSHAGGGGGGGGAGTSITSLVIKNTFFA